LSYTPRRLIQHPHRPLFYVIETDHDTSKVPDSTTNGRSDDGVDGYDAVMYGLPKTGQGTWASCVRIIDPLLKETVFKLDLDENEGAMCATFCRFQNRGDELYFCVGVGQGVSFFPPKVPGAFIHSYLVSSDGKSLELVHKTPVELPPGAILGFQGRLMVGVGKSLRLYEMGIQRLLRKHDSDV
jgi:splicing factor 3B subunit 3